jgi:two-component system, OmpR family, sensor kinase
MMRSLRARLTAGVLVLVACGMLLAGAITYAEQRSFYFQRADEQLRSASPQVQALLENQARGRLPGGGQAPSAGNGSTTAGGGPRRGGPPGAVPFGLPAGTYGQRRSASGKVVAQQVFATSNKTVTARPVLPASLPLAQPITVAGSAGSGTRYRVLATHDPDGAITVVALPLREVDQSLHRLLLVEALVIGGVLVLIGASAATLVRIGLRPLDRMGDTADAIAGGDLSRRVKPSDPRTETGRLGQALNAMLDRLEEAFARRRASEERLRQFLADASHELRTPLVSIRGYAELYRIGAARSPEDIEKSMRRIEDEATRLGVLVEDMLTLARLDQMRAEDHAPLDLAPLIGDAADDARAASPERRIEVHAEGPLEVRGDADGLHQVLVNLLRNALVHTPPDALIELNAGREHGEVRVEVRDHGPGLPTDDPEQLFERFWRADGGRRRGRAGAGLGLSIVAAIVQGHGGTISAANAEGGGASFTVRLPEATRGRAAPPPADGALLER